MNNKIAQRKDEFPNEPSVIDMTGFVHKCFSKQILNLICVYILGLLCNKWVNAACTENVYANENTGDSIFYAYI